MKPAIVWLMLAILLGSPIVAPPRTEAGPAKEQCRIAVLVSHDSPPYAEAQKGFQAYLTQRGLRPDWVVLPLGGDAALARQAIRQLERNPPDLILALGALANRAARDAELEIPIVAGLVMNEDAFRGAENSTGVVLEFPVETQLQWIHRVMPDIRGVGVLYSEEGTLEAIGRATKIAQDLGLRLVTQKVREPKDLPAALDTLARKTDLIWGISDPGVVNAETTRPLLLFSFRNRIPFVGLSAAWVKAGALYSLERDYEDLGIQCGEMAQQVLEGAAADSLPIATPRKVLLSLNVRTAKHMKLDIPESVLSSATLVLE